MGDSSRTVSVICAPPNGRNFGMASVDLAFDAVAQRIPGLTATYWRLWDQSEWETPPGVSRQLSENEFFDPDTGLHYRKLRGHLDEALSSSAVIYWGDFLHMAVYQDHSADVLHRRMGAMTRETADRLVARALMLRGKPIEPHTKIFSYGSTLSMNRAEDYISLYGTDLESLMQKFEHAWFRDPYSAHVARLHRSDSRKSWYGPDAALLHGEPDSRKRRSSIGVFFGRSNLPPESLARFGRHLTEALEVDPHILAWGESPAFWPIHHRKRFRLAWPELGYSTRRIDPRVRLRYYKETIAGAGIPLPSTSLSNVLEQIAGDRVVLTDTYHLALNSWRLGTPAILVADRPTTQWSVNSGHPGSHRDKRRDIYSQWDALGLLVDGNELDPGNNAALVGRLKAYLDDDALVNLTHERIARSKSSALTELTRALSHAVGAPAS